MLFFAPNIHLFTGSLISSAHFHCIKFSLVVLHAYIFQQKNHFFLSLSFLHWQFIHQFFFLSMFLCREILCKPYFSIHGKKNASEAQKYDNTAHNLVPENTLAYSWIYIAYHKNHIYRFFAEFHRKTITLFACINVIKMNFF